MGKVSPERYQAAFDAYAAGSKIPDLARELGVKPQTFRKALERRGLLVTTRPAHKPLTAEERTQASKLYASGLTCAQVGEALGRSGSAIYAYLESTGESLSHGESKRRAIPQATRDKMVELHAAKATLAEIAKALGASTMVVRDELQRRGVIAHSPGRRTRYHNDRAAQERIVELAAQRCPVTWIAEQLGCSRDAVHAVLKARNITPKRAHSYQWTDAAGRIFTFRSTWELRTAAWFDRHQIKWDYEVERFAIGKTKTGRTRNYTPDFWVYDAGGALNYLVEVKGKLTKRCRASIANFQQLHPGTRLEVWSIDELIERGVLTEEEIKWSVAARRQAPAKDRLISRVVSLFAANMTVEQIADRVSRSTSWVSDQLHRRGLTRNRGESRRLRYASPAVRSRIRHLYTAGKSLVTVGKELGISRDVVYGEVRRAGLTRPRRGAG